MEGASIKYLNNYTKCQVVVSLTKAGERTRHKKTFKVSDETLTLTERKLELEEKARNFRNKIKNDEYLDGEETTFEKFVDIFMKKHADKNLSPSTALRYKQLLDRAINSPLGKMNLTDIKPKHLMKFYESLEEKQIRTLKNGKKEEYYLSKQTILHHQKAIGIVLSKAKYWQYVKENVSERVENIKVKREEESVLSIEQLKKMLKCLESEDIMFKTIISLICYMGLRRAEACALKWQDIDFENKTLYVRRNIIEVKGKLIEKETKTSKSTRKITLPESAIKLLKEYKKWQDIERFKVRYS